MKRELMNELIRWKNSPSRKPLLLRGVRQCGKTYLLKAFAKNEYENMVYINFEQNPEFASLFDKDFHTERIMTEMGILYGTSIQREKTLILLDEIQACPKAITALKYFCEEAPEYHIASAGSLIGISISKPNSYPVGKVDVKTLYPMSFKEFLMASDEEDLIKYLQSTNLHEISQAIHSRLFQYYDYYRITGGMPEVVKTWVQEKNIQQVEELLQNLLNLYQLDFSKYAPAKDFQKISQVWEAIPYQLAKENQRFIFGQVKEGARAKDLEDALNWLINAGMVYRIPKIEKPYIPLSAYEKQNLFKIYCCDTGLLRKLAKVDAGLIFKDNSQYTEFKGVLTENYVLQQLIQMGIDKPCYWSSGNKAEVDFVMQLKGIPTPIEVKSGKTIRSKSLLSYIEKYNPEKAYRFSSSLRDSGERIIDIPLPLVWTILSDE